ncbi:unnamed protein product, partial [Meganyctiphanes norvegica]
ECGCQRHAKLPKGMSFSSLTPISDILHAIETSYGGSSCSAEATFRGPSQYVVSLSVFGIFPNEYYSGIQHIVEQVATLYPGWVMRLYHDLDIHDEHQQAWLCQLTCMNSHIDLCNIRNITGLGDISSSHGQVWRMAVIGDPLVKHYIIRDSDSPILQREVDAVQQWLDSGKCFHIMHDHPNHRAVMLAGMWGGCTWWQPQHISRTMMLQLINSTRDIKEDQPSLQKYIWPIAQHSLVHHDAYRCERHPEAIPFPSQRVNGTYVGMRMYRRRYCDSRLRRPCPTACRPPDHQDWETC